MSYPIDPAEMQQEIQEYQDEIKRLQDRLDECTIFVQSQRNHLLDFVPETKAVRLAVSALTNVLKVLKGED